MSLLRRSALPLAVLVLAVFLTPAAQVDAFTPPVTVDLQPAELTVEAGGTRPVTAVIANSGGKVVKISRLTWRTESFVTVGAPSAPVTSLASGGAVETTFPVSFDESAARDTALVLIVAYDTSGVHAVATRSVAVKLAHPVPQAPLTAKLTSAVTELTQHRSTDLVVTITNSSPSPRRVNDVALTVPPFVDVWRADGGLVTRDGHPVIVVDRTAAAGEQIAVVVTIGVTRPLQPGKATLLADVTSRPEPGGAESTAMTSVDLSFAVLGESAFLDVIGLPSLLLVPGLVFAIVLWLLHSRVHPRSGSAPGDMGGIAAKTVFWVLAVPVSIGLDFLYPVVTGLLASPRDIFTSYGIDDILYIWMFGGFVAIVVWLIVWIIPALLNKLWHWLFVPEPDDDAWPLLRKLSNRAIWLPGAANKTLDRIHASWTRQDRQGVPIVVLHRGRGSQSLISSPIQYGPVHAVVDSALQEGNPHHVARALRAGGGTIHFDYRDQKPIMVDNAVLESPHDWPCSGIVEQDDR